MNSADLNKKLQKARRFVEMMNYADALRLYAELVAEFPQATAEYGLAAARSGDFDLADQIWEKVRRLESKNADHLSQLAGEYGKIGLHAKSRALFAKAASLDPGNLDVHIKLAWLLARTSSVGEARPVIAKCLELDPRSEQARYLSAHLDRRENKLADAEQQFRDLIASGLKRLHVHYACLSELAQILDRTERFDEAMSILAEGKKIARQIPNLVSEHTASRNWYENEARKAKALPKNILDTWGKSFPPDAWTAAPPLAFLTGSSRSGTTLLEKILDAHPAVVAFDESLAFRTIQPRIDLSATPMPAPQLNLLRQRYLKNLTNEPGPPGDGKILVDKNPAWTVWLPAFLRAFPELRVLIALRDPRDVMISLYFQDHPGTNCQNFEQLAQHYASVMSVWLAVREWDGLSWMETRYEDIVADVQKEGGRVTKFLGLEWHEGQARFYESNLEKPVLSTNYNDVTKPVYTRSVGRWRVYEKHLAPILPALAPYCKMFGYE